MGSDNARMRGRRAWIVPAVLNALPIVFGSSFIWWPSDDVRRHNGTDGLFHVNRYVWGVYVILSAAAMLAVAVTGFRRGAPWAWSALWYDVVFFAAVALIEPDYFFPVLFGIIVVATLLYTRRKASDSARVDDVAYGSERSG